MSQQYLKQMLVALHFIAKMLSVKLSTLKLDISESYTGVYPWAKYVWKK